MHYFTELLFKLPRPKGPAQLALEHADLAHGEGSGVVGPPAALLALSKVVALTEVGKPTRQKIEL